MSLNRYIIKNSRSLSVLNSEKIKDFDKRVIYNIKNTGLFFIPDHIKNVYDLLIYCDPNGGKCGLVGCDNKKKLKSGRRWILNDFCSRSCSDTNFSSAQKDNNTSKRMTKDTKENMRRKLSRIVSEKIKSGVFTPGATNSWCHSKIEVLIKGKIFKVRSSWEALFFILNPNFLYENIRIEYLDTRNNKIRNYIVDFCDTEKKVLYEIKPSNKEKDSIDKRKAAEEWCEYNGYSFVYITEDWIVSNYNPDVLKLQPEANKILERIDKTIKRM
jgi:very-short-patch-repair endonuclease